ncbi:MAG: magnetosome biogenesis CDF transporter MamM [Nitrospirae bacterium]|nr:magnetosome biogenesis CDF transporter MamM [Nitrospirota bacterium]
MHRLPHVDLSYKECGKCINSASWIAVFSNLVLFVFKAIIGYISGSRAILSDSLYSFKDFMMSAVVLVGVKISGKPADEDHPYGHGKIEFVAIFLISIFIIIGTLFLLVHSIKDVWYVYKGTDIAAPKFIAFWAALISVVANYKLSTYLHCVGSKIKSPAMLANSKHNHSDAESSALVAAAIFGTRLGFHFLDPLAAVIETLDLIRLSVHMINDSLKGMLDSSISKVSLNQIQEIAMLVPGVRKISKLVARKVGSGIWVDIVIRVDQHQTLEEGHIISNQVRETIMKKIANITGINLTIEPNRV